MDRLMKPLTAFCFLFLTSVLCPGLGLSPSHAATITLDLVDSSAMVDVMLDGGTVGGDDHNEGYDYAYTSVTVGNNWVNGERFSGTYVGHGDPDSIAAITLYGSHEGSIEDGFTASGGGDISSDYDLTIASDYGATGPTTMHIIINEGLVPPDGGGASFTILDSGYNYIFGWNEADPYGGGDIDEWIGVMYGEVYHIESGLSFDFEETGPSDFYLDFTQSMEMWVNEPAPVPIPGALWLLGSGLFGLVAVRRRVGDKKLLFQQLSL